MWLSTKGRYGLRLMFELDLHNKETISISQISKSQEITPQSKRYEDELAWKVRL
jgi:DNA-binding IscR family transcriptional regulator